MSLHGGSEEILQPGVLERLREEVRLFLAKLAKPARQLSHIVNCLALSAANLLFAPHDELLPPQALKELHIQLAVPLLTVTT